MTMLNSTEIKCVKCNCVFPMITHDSVNVTMAPRLKEELLDGTLNQGTCPDCGMRYNIGSAVLYHDMENKIMIYALLSEEYSNNKIAAVKDFSGMLHNMVSSLAVTLRNNFEKYNFDVVFSIEELKESLGNIEKGIYTEKIKDTTKNVLESKPKTIFVKRFFEKLLLINSKEENPNKIEKHSALEKNITINGEKISLKYFPKIADLYEIEPKGVEDTIYKIMHQNNIDAKNALIILEKLYAKVTNAVDKEMTKNNTQ